MQINKFKAYIPETKLKTVDDIMWTDVIGLAAVTLMVIFVWGFI